MSQWLMCVEIWIHSSMRKWTEERARHAPNAAAMGLPLPALIGRHTRPGVRNVALFCKHLSRRGMQAANTLLPFVPKSTYLVRNSNQPTKSVLWTMGATR
jgi:hypothetical protein